MIFEPVDVPSTYEETIRRLGNAIRIGVLQPGTRLPPERELATKLSISRSTLRQALSSLTDSGHLIAVRGRAGGTFVAATPPLASTLPFDLQRVHALMDWRMALELGAVHLAAARADAAAADALAETAAEGAQRDVVDDWTRFRRADAAFHVRVAEATGSPRLVASVTEVHGELSDLFDRLEPPASTRRATLEEHAAVVAAVRDGDQGRACAAMREHLAATEVLVDQLRTSVA